MAHPVAAGGQWKLPFTSPETKATGLPGGLGVCSASAASLVASHRAPRASAAKPATAKPTRASALGLWRGVARGPFMPWPPSCPAQRLFVLCSSSSVALMTVSSGIPGRPPTFRRNLPSPGGGASWLDSGSQEGGDAQSVMSSSSRAEKCTTLDSRGISLAGRPPQTM